MREVCGALGNTSLGLGETAGAIAAFFYATNLTMVLSDRTIRMYPLLMATELLQIFFFCRAQRRGTWTNYRRRRFHRDNDRREFLLDLPAFLPRRYGSSACCSPKIEVRAPAA